MVFDRVNPSSTDTFLDIRSDVDTSGSEEGLLGLAFHPNFNSNGEFFVYYSRAGESATVLSRFNIQSGNPRNAQESSEEILLTIDQPFSNHNGGQIQFGPDGFLYIAVGDGGSGNDPQGNGQNTNTLLGSLLRIDIDNEDAPNNYAIPSSNPFASSGGAPEIYSYGLRNPWRFSFDSQTGNIWIGDVGQGSFEEISVATMPGQNFGWVKMEACSCNSAPCNNDLIRPIHSYPRNIGQSVTGGYVYRKNEISEISNSYIFADYVTGRIFAIDADSTSPDCGTSASELFDTSFSISTFGMVNGDILFADLGTGNIYKLSPDGTPVSTTPSATRTRTSTSSKSFIPSLSSNASPSSTPSRTSSITKTPEIDNPPNPPLTFSKSTTSTNNDVTITIEWEVDGDFIHFQASAIVDGWLAIGFSSDGSMDSDGNGSDIVMGYVDGSANVNDYFTQSKSQPELDEQQNLFFTDAFYEGNRLFIQFTRALNTGDSFEDRIISLGVESFVIWASSDTLPENIDDFTRHSSRDSVSITFGSPDPSISSSRTLTPSNSRDVPNSQSVTSNPNPSNSRTSSKSPEQNESISSTPSRIINIDDDDNNTSFTSGITSFSSDSSSDDSTFSSSSNDDDDGSKANSIEICLGLFMILVIYN
eukprot:CAMPEP_0206176744 /NCGR_PEP_ID=MMETSP1474-20131121/59027_1 /ASSEMBLY_ACC=CAM_ASM_001110 /TAXON_ID=97495 /ORGANISM="Imantonia sp., Strain RCC918" /LENGTH=644 /DNA_ID=CAMNT_0053588007 /DNA_START=176 /DNA_END=2107 /DNA_ORIENTATION=-